MQSTFHLYPAILTTNEVVAQSQLTMCSTFETCSIVQIDVIDGIFADNLTISPLDFPALTYNGLGIDVHLMVEEPLDFVYELVSVKDVVPIRAVIIQPERVSGMLSVLEEIRQQDWKVGVSLNVGTDVDDIMAELSDYLEHISIWQVMGVPAGFQGQRFNPGSVSTLTRLVELLPTNHESEILLDGGVSPDTLDAVLRVGATGVVVGSYLWKHQDPLEQWHHLLQKIAE